LTVEGNSGQNIFDDTIGYFDYSRFPNKQSRRRSKHQRSQMNETTRALLKSGFTLGGGLVTFLGGQIFLKLMDAAIALHSIIAELDCDLTLYLVDSAVAQADERYRIFRRHSGRLQAAAWSVIGYSYFQDKLHLPPREDVLRAAEVLLQLAVYDAESDKIHMVTTFARDSEREIRKLLRVFVNLFNRQRGYVHVERVMRLRPKVKELLPKIQTRPRQNLELCRTTIQRKASPNTSPRWRFLSAY
jgi:hypothetical protein